MQKDPTVLEKLINTRQQRQKLLELPLQQQYILHFSNTLSGIVLIHKLVDSADNDYTLLISIAMMLADEGKTVELLPKLHEKDVNFRKKVLPGVRMNKNPDLRIDGLYWEVEEPKHPYGNNNINQRIRKGQEQADNLILHFRKNVSIALVESLLKERLRYHHQFRRAEVWINCKRVKQYTK